MGQLVERWRRRFRLSRVEVLTTLVLVLIPIALIVMTNEPLEAPTRKFNQFVDELQSNPPSNREQRRLDKRIKRRQPPSTLEAVEATPMANDLGGE